MPLWIPFFWGFSGLVLETCSKILFARGGSPFDCITVFKVSIHTQIFKLVFTHLPRVFFVMCHKNFFFFQLKRFLPFD